MSDLIKRWMEITFTILVIAWVLTRSSDFARVARAIADFYTSSVRALRPA